MNLHATHSEQYTQTTKEIANYVGRNFTKYTAALVTSPETLSLPMPVESADPDPADVVAVNSHRQLYGYYLKQTEAYNDFKASL
jgi:hypothetical protein